jgi:hypothetical protein
MTLMTCAVFFEAPPPDASPNNFAIAEENDILEEQQGRPPPRGGAGGGGVGGNRPRPAQNGGLASLGSAIGSNIGKLANNPLASLLPSPLQPLLPTPGHADGFGFIPTQFGSFLANPLPTLASLLPRPLAGLENLIPTPKPTSGAPPPKGGSHPPNNPIKPSHIPGLPALPNLPNIVNPLNKQHPPPSGPSPFKESKPPKSGKPGHEAQCTQQEISCNFVREAAYQMQNDDDDCLKLATSFDADGKIHFEPIAQDNENVIYGLTTDGLTASAWCNDIGWALRKIYINCRRSNKCYGG